MRPAARPRGARLPAPERPPPLTVDEPRALALLREGELRVVGRLVGASNVTLYCEASDGELTGGCVYKPVRGERPLWDFPEGTLARREVAAYAVSAATGWDVVPPTVLRDGPLGPGMVQLWIEPDPSVSLTALVRSDRPELRQIALYDAVVNNADRKGGHLLPRPDGHVYGVDHGVCFHVEPKLRTVLWGWRGLPFTAGEVAALRSLRAGLGGGELGGRLGELLPAEEVAATAGRLDALVESGRFPQPGADWPPVPWPPF